MFLNVIVLTNFNVFKQFLLTASLISFTSVHGCGQLPQGEVTAVTFTASGFTLPPEMVYSGNAAVQMAITSISNDRETVIKIVKDLIMNAVNDVLQENGRNAFLPDAAISQILQQLNINIDYTPLECPTATKEKANTPTPIAMKDGRFIIDGVVTSLCTTYGAQANDRCRFMPQILHVEPIPAKYRTIKGDIKTSNVIIANWTKQMWQNILNKMYRRLTTGRFGKYFTTTVITVDS